MSKLPRTGQSWSSKRRKRFFDLTNIKKSLGSVYERLKKTGMLKNILLGVVAFGLLCIILFLGFFAYISRDLPDPNSLALREVPESTKIYDRTGEHLLYEISGDEKRTLVTLDQMPDYLLHATITAEDRKFYKHRGIDIKGIMRAVFSNITSFDPTGEGASTITQQLVKNAILTNEKSYIRKVKEILLSLALERRYEKDEILQLYLNEIPYGSRNYGIESAAQAYFKKSTKDLTLAEAATLAALPQSPSRFLNNPERLEWRKHWILDSMVEEGYITREEADAAKAESTPVVLSFSSIEAPHFVLWVKELLVEEYGERMVEQGGLTVITSLDYEKQKIAEEVVVNNKAENGERYQFNNSGLVALDPSNGHIVSMVGSADYFDDEIDGQVNVALRPLQPGSSFKPIIYAAGFEAGYTPNSILWDVETDFATSTGNYHPRNYSLNENGPVTIRKALQGSLNIPAVKMLALIGVDSGLDFAEKLHYTGFGDRSRFGLAIVLGGAEVQLIEHTAAYAAFANDGVYHEPVPILKVQTSAGDVLQEWTESEGERVMDANVARMVSDVLSDDAARAYAFGRNSNLTLPGRRVAAKTGTTNDYNDAWTMGYTPQLVTGVWTGNTDGTQMNRAGGSSAAAPIWNAYMRRALEGEPALNFTAPSIPVTGKDILDGKIPSETVTIDSVSGLLATEETPERFRETKTCGEFHTILHFVNPSNPRGDAPSNPERNPMYASWESGVQAYLERQRVKAEETGEPAMEVCEIPTESDDVHTAQNRPGVTIRQPGTNQTVQGSFEVDLRINSNRPILRVEYFVDGTLVRVDENPSGVTLQLPTWVGSGSRTLTVTAYDDVENSGTDEIKIDIQNGEVVRGISITNPFNLQTIEKSDQPYSIIIESQNIADLTSLTLSARNLWTGAESVIGEVSNPQSITSFSWTLPDEAHYVLSARATRQNGQTVDAAPIRVKVEDPAGPPGLVIDLLGGDQEEE